MSVPYRDPDFEAIADMRIGDMTPAQRGDSLEYWIRQNLGWMGDYHAPKYQLLLSRLDAARDEIHRLRNLEGNHAP